MERYLLQQPVKLESLALKKLGHYIALQAKELVAPITELRQRDAAKAEALLSRQIENIRTRLASNVPRMLHDELLHDTIRALMETDRSSRCPENLYLRDSQTYVFGRMVETLFTKNVTFISVDDSIKANMFLASLCSKSYMLTGLTRLRVLPPPNAIVFIPENKENETIQLLKGLQSLERISLNYCSDGILRCIAENCKFIEMLDLSDTFINDNSIDILIKLCYLRSVELRDTEVTQEGIETLLMSCPNIEYIGTRFIAHALEHIASLKENAGRQFKLKSFENYLDTTLKQLKLLVTMCPLIQNIHFDNCPVIRSRNVYYLVENRVPVYYRYKLKVLNDLQDLRKMTLKNYSFYRDQIKEMLILRGHNLVELVLDVYEMDFNALKCMMQACPNLQSLSLDLLFHYEEQNMCSILRRLLKYLCTFVTDLFRSEIKTAPLNNLKRLFLNIDADEPMHQQFLIFLLSSCPNIEIISTGYDVSLTDDVMFTVLDKNPFICLKELKMWKSQLSVLFIERFAQSCISSPKVTITPFATFKAITSI